MQRDFDLGVPCESGRRWPRCADAPAALLAVLALLAGCDGIIEIQQQPAAPAPAVQPADAAAAPLAPSTATAPSAVHQPAPRVVAENDAPALKYAFEKGKYFGYETVIQVDTTDETETITLESVYHVIDVRPDSIRLYHNGQERVARKLKPGEPGRTQRGGRQGPVRPDWVTIAPSGELLEARNLQSIDHLLGYQETIALERLPPQGQEQWDVQENFDVKKTRFPFSSSRFTPGPRQGAWEKSNYRINRREADLVWIDKQYAMEVSESVGDATRIQMTGSGQFAFDQRLGRLTQLTMDYTQTLTTRGKDETVTMHLDCRPLEPAKLQSQVDVLERVAREQQAAFDKKDQDRAAAKKAAVAAKGSSGAKASPKGKRVAPALPAKSVARVWHDITGKFQVEAEFVGEEADQVVLKRTEGTTLKVPRGKLSDADQQWLKEHTGVK